MFRIAAWVPLLALACSKGVIDTAPGDPPDHCWAPVPFEGVVTATDNPEGIRLGPDGALYIADFSGVYRISPDDPETLTLFASDPATVNLQGLDFGPDGTLYVASRDRNAVVRFDGTTGAFLDVFADGTSGFQLPNTPRVGFDGRVYISSRDTGEIFRFESDGTLDGVFATHPSMGSPEDMDFGPDGSFFVAARTESVVLRFDVNGVFQETFAGPPSIQSPEGLSFGEDGSVWVNSRDSLELLHFEADGTEIERIDVPSRPIGLTLAGCDQPMLTLREPGRIYPLP